MAQTSLAKRFAYGSNEFDSLTPESTEQQELTAMPTNIALLSDRLPGLMDRLNKQIVENKNKKLPLLRRRHAQNGMALNEIRYQLSSLELTTIAGFAHVGEGLTHLEDTMAVELGEVRWVLGQMDEGMAQLVHLVGFPRETEARELVEDGIKALASSNFDDAEACLQEAIQKKRTHFQAHTNLAFVYIHKNEADKALLHFKKAADYAPDTPDGQARFMALENLARAYFTIEDYGSARHVMAQAMALNNNVRTLSKDDLLEHMRQRFGGGEVPKEEQQIVESWPPPPPLSSEYRYAVYHALEGHAEVAIGIIVTLCQQKPSYFAIAASDADLEGIREPLMEALDDLARFQHDKAESLLGPALAGLDEALNDIDDKTLIGSEVAQLRSALVRARDQVSRDNFSDSNAAVQSMEAVIVAMRHLSELGEARTEYQLAEARHRICAEELRQAEESLEREEHIDDVRHRRHRRIQRFFGMNPWPCAGMFLVLAIPFVVWNTLSGTGIGTALFLLSVLVSAAASVGFLYAVAHWPYESHAQLQETRSAEMEKMATFAASRNTLQGLDARVKELEREVRRAS